MKLTWPEWANWFAVDSSGEGYFYKDKPVLNIGLSQWSGDKCSFAGDFILGDIDWKKALIEKYKIITRLKEPMKYIEAKKQLEEL